MVFIDNITHNTTLTLQDQIVLAPDQVDSKTLVQRPDFSITLFAVASEQEIGGHSAKGDAMVNVLSGTAEVVIENTSYTVRAGETIIIPANARHSLYAVEGFKMLLVVVKPQGAQADDKPLIEGLAHSAVLPLAAQLAMPATGKKDLMLVRRLDAAMKLIATATGESRGGHETPGDAMVNVLSGQATITVEGKAHTLQAGKTIVITKGAMHTLHADEAFKALVISVKPQVG